MGSAATLFVVDDDPGMQKSLRELGESVALRVETFGSAVEFLSAYDSERPGCLLLDLRLPGMGGLELQQRLSAAGLRVPIIIITGYGDVSAAVRAMKAGAVDFVEKPFSAQTLLERIQAAITLDAQLRQEQSKHAEFATRFARLTPREKEVLDLLADGRSVKAIAVQLGLSHKTVQVHRARIMDKLEVTSTAEMVRQVVESRPALPDRR
jgi:two-component system, LuxR family, response regulator FixJ